MVDSILASEVFDFRVFVGDGPPSARGLAPGQSGLPERSDLQRQSVVIDVRSEGEFAEASIPGSFSVPLLNNHERAEVGTLYKQVGADAAWCRAAEIVLPKLESFAGQFAALSLRAAPRASAEARASLLSKNFPEIFRRVLTELRGPQEARCGANKNSDKPTLIFYCWRGGARSQSMALLAQELGYSACVVSGGHRAFRNEVQRYLAQENYPFQLAVLDGFTGSGKTQLLQKWARGGEAVMDLEGLAHHRGSAFGQIGIGELGRQKDFENNLYWQMKFYERQGAREVLVEGESQRIGRCSLPERFFRAMHEGRHILLESTLEQRVQNILREYVDPAAEQALLEGANRALGHIEKKLGGELATKLRGLLGAKDYEAFTRELLLRYYDKLYARTQLPREAYAEIIKAE